MPRAFAHQATPDYDAYVRSASACKAADCVLLAKAFVPPTQPYVCLDLFAGERAVSKAFAHEGQKSLALDICLDRRDDPWLEMGGLPRPRVRIC